MVHVSDVTLADVFVLSVTSDELENVESDGDTVADVVVLDFHTVDLRAERQGNGNGRVYTITVAAEDTAGNRGTASFPVWVPQSKERDAVDNGPAHEVESRCVAPAAAAKVAEEVQKPVADRL